MGIKHDYIPRMSTFLVGTIFVDATPCKIVDHVSSFICSVPLIGCCPPLETLASSEESLASVGAILDDDALSIWKPISAAFSTNVFESKCWSRNPMNLKLKFLADVTPLVQICISFSYTGSSKNSRCSSKVQGYTLFPAMLRKKTKSKEIESFPQTLAGFGYYVKPDGSIRSIQSGKMQALIGLRDLQERYNFYIQQFLSPNRHTVRF